MDYDLDYELRTVYNVDYIRPHYYFDSMANTMAAVFVQATLGSTLSIFCIVLNLSLLYFCLREEEFRDMKFFSVYFQAVVDVIGPGIANCVHEVLVYQSLDFWADYDSESTTSSFIFNIATAAYEMSIPIGSKTIGCIVNLFRLSLNEYSTGWCIVVTAFVRYILVCHPTISSDILTRAKLTSLACFLVLLPVSVVLVDTFWEDVYGFFAKLKKTLFPSEFDYSDYSYDYDYDYDYDNDYDYAVKFYNTVDWEQYFYSQRAIPERQPGKHWVDSKKFVEKYFFLKSMSVTFS